MATLRMFEAYRDSARALAPGEVLFSRGDAGTAMFAVLEGELEMSSDGRTIETVGAGGIVGEMAIIDDAPRSATATAVGPTRVVEVDEKQFIFMVHEHPTFAVMVMRVMADRLRRANEMLDGAFKHDPH
jgi:CRP/FNR family transcriptional regulator, cyclic AMP receptor protein